MLGLILFAIYFATVSTLRYTQKMKNSQALPEVTQELCETQLNEPETNERANEVQTPSETSQYAVEPASLLTDNDLIEYAKTLGIRATRRWKRDTILERIRTL